MKRSPMKPRTVPMRRSGPPARAKAGAPAQRHMLRPVSQKAAKKRAEAKPIREAYLEEHQMCQAAEAGAPGRCFGAVHVHEIRPRARGGDIADRSIFRSVCDHHNTAISQDAETMRWAYRAGFLEHAWSA